MKKITHYILLLAVLSGTACNKELNEDVRSQVTDNYINTPTGFEDAVRASYSHIRKFYGSGENGSSCTVFGTDEFTNGSDGSFKSMNLYDNNLNPRIATISGLWNDMYIAINNCNAVVSRAGEVTGMDEALKTTRVAETRFLRAFYYFLLVQTFGPVHLTLEETLDPEFSASRAPVAEVYQAIIADLDFAVANLPETATNYGRATKPAAEFLLSKVHLTRASSAAAQPDDYTKAATLAKSVINNYSFSLLDEYARIFDQGAGEKSSEVVWSVQNSTNLQSNETGNTLHLYFLMEYDALPGMRRDVANGRPFKRYRPTPFVLNELFDRENDSRYEADFKRVFLCNNPGTYTFNGNRVDLATGDTAIYVADREFSPAEIAATKYAVYPPSRQNERIFPTLTKFLDPTRLDVGQEPGTRDFLVFRISEAYLIAAEALMYTGQTAEAATLVNAVRTRAAKPGSEAAMQITAAQLNIDFILDERAREFLGELMRWFDLVRTKKLIERVKKYNAQAAPNIRDFHVLRPIPQDQIDRTEGGVSAFPQNPGY
ncbi:MAG: RagB/SusD family nutrient uptake outer membrane protein [Mucilaginibacter polytrichastri]|nr:RagB/SusD family nutrient uptake outer membrane protein [Mucilaginibacter polytrichastri]